LSRMLKKNDHARIEKFIGYEFLDVSLLELALSHRSVGKLNNERLEFLGDALLGMVISEALYQKFPAMREGELSRLRSQLVRGETLAELVREMQLCDYIQLGGGELKSGGHRRVSIQADVAEAILGAIYLDSGFEACKNTVLSWFASRLQNLSGKAVKKDPKTHLQEYMQERGKALPSYALASEMGDDHARKYKVECRLDNESTVFFGVATSKRNAEKEAAANALRFLGELADER